MRRCLEFLIPRRDVLTYKASLLFANLLFCCALPCPASHSLNLDMVYGILSGICIVMRVCVGICYSR